MLPHWQVGIDDALVMETKEEIFELNNGCVCCTGQHGLLGAVQSPLLSNCWLSGHIFELHRAYCLPQSPQHLAPVLCCVCLAVHHPVVRGDLIRTVNKLLKRRNKFDAIIIETTGLANPAPVIQVRWWP